MSYFFQKFLLFVPSVIYIIFHCFNQYSRLWPPGRAPYADFVMEHFVKTQGFLWFQVQRIVPKDPDATKKLKECEKAVTKIRFEEAIANEDHERHSVAESLDFRSIGTHI